MKKVTVSKIHAGTSQKAYQVFQSGKLVGFVRKMTAAPRCVTPWQGFTVDAKGQFGDLVFFAYNSTVKFAAARLVAELGKGGY